MPRAAHRAWGGLHNSQRERTGPGAIRFSALFCTCLVLRGRRWVERPICRMVVDRGGVMMLHISSKLASVHSETEVANEKGEILYTARPIRCRSKADARCGRCRCGDRALYPPYGHQGPCVQDLDGRRVRVGPQAQVQGVGQDQRGGHPCAARCLVRCHPSSVDVPLRDSRCFRPRCRASQAGARAARRRLRCRCARQFARGADSPAIAYRPHCHPGGFPSPV